MTDALEARFGALTAALVTALALAAALSTLAPVPGPARAAAVLGFGLIGPGAAIAGLLKIRALAPWAMVTLGGSIAVGVVATSFAAIASWWHPQAVLVGMATLSTAAALVACRRPVFSAPAACQNR